MPTETRRRSRRLELRTTFTERSLIERAAAVKGVGLTDFVLEEACQGALRVLADRQTFALDDRAQAEWEDLNARPARELPGLHRLMQRPSPFGGDGNVSSPEAAEPDAQPSRVSEPLR